MAIGQSVSHSLTTLNEDVCEVVVVELLELLLGQSPAGVGVEGEEHL